MVKWGILNLGVWSMCTGCYRSMGSSTVVSSVSRMYSFFNTRSNVVAAVDLQEEVVTEVVEAAVGGAAGGG